MTKTLQAAAQALYSACCNYGSQREQDIRDAAKLYEAALSTPPPSEEEAVKKLMRLVDEAIEQAKNLNDGNMDSALARVYGLHLAEVAIEQAARQMLRSAQEDARDAARYRWLVNTRGDHLHGLPSIWSAFDDDIDDYRAVSFWGLREKADLDGAIDAAMQKETP